MRGRVVLAVLVSCSMPAAAMLPQQRDPRAPVNPTAQTGTGSIGGVVTDRRQGPLATAIVRIAIDGGPTKRETMTDAGGRFRFGSLPAGRYAVSAHKPGYLDEWFGRSASAPASELIALGPGQAIADVSIALTKTAAISGIVTGDTAEPIRAQVRVIPRNRPLTEQLGVGVNLGAMTDAGGRYRIASLPPGEYLVSAHSLEATDARTPGPDGRDRQFSFLDTYFPGSVRAQDAAPVQINEGDVVSGINIQLFTLPAGTAEGQLTHVSGLPVQGQQVTFVTRDRIRYSAIPMDGGRFRIAGLAYGEYDVLASGAVKPESASMQIGWARGAAVVGPDRVDLALTLTPGGAMSGRVSMEDGAAATGIKIRAVPIDLVPSALNGSNLFSVPIAADGAFVFANLPTGRYVVGLELSSKVLWSIDQVQIGGQRLADEMVEVVSGLSLDGVHVSVIDTHADISGTVTGSDGTPVRGVLVAAFPDRTIPGGRSMSGVTDAAGRYLLASLPLGRYRVEAIMPQGVVINDLTGTPRPDQVIVVVDARGQKKVVDFRR